MGKIGGMEADRAPTLVQPHDASQAEEELVEQNQGTLDGSAKAPQAANLTEDNLTEDNLKEDNLKGDNLKEGSLEEDNLKEDTEKGQPVQA